MTEKPLTRDEQFAKFGCACKCLFALSLASGSGKTKTEFIDEFTQQYAFWEKQEQCGIADTGIILDMARKLGLATSFQIFIGKDSVRKQIKEEKVRGILLFTERQLLEDGSIAYSNHCRLAEISLREDARWTILCVDEQLNVGSPEYLSDSQIDERWGYFLLLL